MALQTKIEELIAPTIQDMGLVLWGCELHQAGRHTTLRIYVDGSGDQGVTLDACADVSREVGALLDVEDPIKSNYQLEVSSPGVERPLYSLDQYEKYIGHEVKIKLSIAQLGRRQFVGRIEKVEDNQVFVAVDDEVIAVGLNDIQKANLVMKVGS